MHVFTHNLLEYNEIKWSPDIAIQLFPYKTWFSKAENELTCHRSKVMYHELVYCQKDKKDFYRMAGFSMNNEVIKCDSRIVKRSGMLP